MSIEVTGRVSVERSPEDVAQVMFNPKKDKLWVRSLREVYPMESGLYKKGARIERIGNFLNKHYSAKLLVTKMEENSFCQLYADEPFEMYIKYNLKETEEGTDIALTISSISEVEFNSPVSIIMKSIQEMIDGDLAKLKKHLEH
ncbi:MAG: hypothetical protein HKN33_00790 [Pyrinomonadaceae bacterium]|nr:hypothetical protein [Pyrinomonadaceae bacterium]